MLIHQDPHCNLFWTYNVDNRYENNITKALVNTLESLPNETVFKLLQDLLKITGYENDIKVDIEYALQRKPCEDIIKSFAEKDRYLWAISPTGRQWEPNDIQLGKIDFNDKKASINIISKNYINKGYDEEKAVEIANSVFEEIKEFQENKGGSIPDGWILVYYVLDGKRIPLLCVAIENKRYDLDPYQLKNHLEKSLFKKNNAEPIFNTYEDIYKMLWIYKENVVVKSFLEYMSLLGFEPFIDFWSTDFENHEDNSDFYNRIFKDKFYKYFKDLMRNSKDFSSIFDINICDQMYLQNIRDFNLTFYIENKSLSISTEVGVKGRDANNKLIKELKRNRDLSNQINNMYKPAKVFFARFVRLLFVQKSLYYEIAKYNSLNDYLDNIDENKIAYWLAREEAGKAFENLKVFEKNPSKVDFRNYKYKEGHWLEYFRITSEVNLEEYSNNNGISHRKELSEKIISVIKTHSDGIKKLNDILVKLG